MGFFSAYNDARNAERANQLTSLADQRQSVSDEESRMKRFREAEQFRAAQQGVDLPSAQGKVGYFDTPAGPAPAQGQQTGGGAAYVPRTGAPAPDKSIEISEASNRLQAMRRAQGVSDKPGLSAMDKLMLQRGTMSQPEGEAIRRMDARAQVVPNAQIDAMQQRLSGLQSEEAARQRGKAPSAGGYAKESDLRGAATQDIGAAPGAIDREIAALQRDLGNVTSPADKALINEELQRLQAQKVKYAGAQYTPGARAPAGPLERAVNAVVPSAQAQTPTVANQSFGPNQEAGPNLATQQQIEYLKRLLPVATNAEQAGQIRAQIQSLQIGDLVHRAGSDEAALGQLAGVAGLQVARTPTGYVLVANDPRTGTRQALGQPVPAAALANQIRLHVDPAYQAAYQKHQMTVDAKRQEIAAELQKAIAVAQAQGDTQIGVQAMETARALQLKLMDLQQEKSMVDPLQGGLWTTRQGAAPTYTPQAPSGFKGVTAP